MTENLISLIVLISPVAFAATALASWFQPGNKPKLILKLSLVSTLISIMIAALGSYFVLEHTLIQSGLLGIYKFGLSIRLDALSMLMFSMIALLGFIIIKFSRNYLDGDQRHGAFIGRLAATIASVQLLVLSGNLGILLISWILTSMSLHRLLVFYEDRPSAQIAARKKFILARMGDACLFIAIALLYSKFESGNLEDIFATIKNSPLALSGVEAPAIFLALAAVFKSAQFPTHGWLIEVMETPTPVSALLHAGLLNAGPFLIVRMAMVMDAASVAPLMLLIIGGFTALFGSVVYLTQTSIKTALGYSSVAHMGFSLMSCGLGLYSAAMLHLVAHSFYKAHSFLASGSVIEVIKGHKISKVTQSISPFKIGLAILLAVGLFTGFSMIWGIEPEKEFSLLVIGAVITMGIAKIITSAIASKNSYKLIAQSLFMVLVVATAFFTLESGMSNLLSSQVPEIKVPGTGIMITSLIILITFAAVVLIQLLSSRLVMNSKYHALSVHIKNGLYANALFDRIVGALHVHSPEAKKVIEHQPEEQLQTERSSVLDYN